VPDPDAYEPAARWPVDLRGVTESVVTTLGPNERWNVATLGLEVGEDQVVDGERAQPVVTARTWGRTRTRRNFQARGEGYVQFTPDPVDFVEAAMDIREEDDPVLERTSAWARVEVLRAGEGVTDGTEWVDWRLTPVESVVREETVPTINRGYNALVEATVVASRLDVEGYDREVLEGRLEYLLDVVRRCGGEREHVALERFENLLED
jgi:hypothetical protein